MLRSKTKFRNIFCIHIKKVFKNFVLQFSISRLHSKKGARNRASRVQGASGQAKIYLVFFFFSVCL